MFKKKETLNVTQEEKAVIINVLIDYRNMLIREGKYSDAVDDVILKLAKYGNVAVVYLFEFVV